MVHYENILMVWHFFNLIIFTNYDFHSGKNVETIILSSLAGARGKILDFSQRLEIAIDIAHGLTYLHLYAGMLLFFASYSLFLVCNGLFVLETPVRDQ